MNYEWDIYNPEGYFNRMGKYKTNKELNFILSHIKKDNKRVLDLGGGSGRFAFPLVEKGYDVTVVDLNNDAIELCKSRGLHKAYCQDIRELKIGNYDTVLAMELFLVTPPDEVFQVAYKNLGNKGKLIFLGTNKNSWRYKLHNLKPNKTHNYGELDLSEYKQLLRKNNFSNIVVEGFNWIPFSVNSNNILISLFAKIEKYLKLYRWISQSPWLLFACEKDENS